MEDAIIATHNVFITDKTSSLILIRFLDLILSSIIINYSLNNFNSPSYQFDIGHISIKNREHG